MPRRSIGLNVLATVTALLASFGASSVAHAQIINGSFETGDLTGWTHAGFTGPDNVPAVAQGSPHTYMNFITSQNAGITAADSNAAVTAQTTTFDGFVTSGPAVGPADGAFLAFISNEPATYDGFKVNSLAGSSISQSFLVPVGATSLEYDVQFLSNEDIDSHWDFGGVALLDGTTVLGEYNLDHDATSALGADAHVIGTPAGGFADSTGWLSQSFNLTGLSGRTLTLTAYVANTGEQSVESRLLLENVRTSAAAVPEPGSLALLMSVGLTGSVVAFSRLRKGRK